MNQPARPERRLVERPDEAFTAATFVQKKKDLKQLYTALWADQNR